eukprot:TRINITY_DN1300_c0_g1_i2.p1 TRINITY_DN1300_c0_g1~~TRINITY_DN1300_c0_g1_i2.p1  ORF type:complete len:219 (+),score=43.57 TRINITY_DN1300_c0_g1_i2:422-1078(+)
MLELGITKYEGFTDSTRVIAGSKPMMLFHGSLFNTNPTFQRIQNLFADFFRGKIIEKVQLLGLDHVIDVTVRPTNPSKEITVADDGRSVENATIMVRHYAVALKKSGTKIPKIELTNVGPTIDFEVRRVAFATPQMFKFTCKQPKGVIVKNAKNMSTDMLGQHGQLHLEAQTKKLATMGTRKFKAHKRKRSSGMGLVEGSDEVGPSILPKTKKPKTTQ